MPSWRVLRHIIGAGHLGVNPVNDPLRRRKKENISDTQTVTNGRDSARLVVMAAAFSIGFVAELLLNLIDLKNA